MLIFLVYSLACYRLALMLSDDSGPYKIFTRFRAWLKRESRQHPAVRKSDVAHGAECLRCSSVWVAAPLGIYLHTFKYLPKWLVAIGDCFVIVMAISAAAILLHRAFPKR